MLLLVVFAVFAGCRAPEGFSAGAISGGDGSGGDISGTGGDIGAGNGGDVGSGSAGTGGDASGGSGGAAVDTPPDGAADGPDATTDMASALPQVIDARDTAPEMTAEATFENDCLPVRWSATASISRFTAINAIDGDPTTMWSTSAAQGGGEFFQVNFPGPVRLNRIVLDNSAGSSTDYPRAYQVLISIDGTTFPGTATTGAPAAGAVTTIDFSTMTVRAFRILQTGSDPKDWWTIREMQLGCQPMDTPPPGAIDPFDPSKWTVSASTSASGFGTNNAIDEDFATHWTTGIRQRGDEWFLIDMGAPAMVGEVWMTTRSSAADFAAQYALEVSTNGTTFNQVATGSGQTVTKIKITPVSARYVRIKQTANTGSTGSWWSIDELSIRP
ncbi:MAG TPA: discoidin domain-containing protein [Polyangia bacterium]